MEEIMDESRSMKKLVEDKEEIIVLRDEKI